jgi:histidinol phosphatase-like PHP family hydrolase
VTQTPSNWPYPGSRWWKFDFHTHTPKSADADGWRRAIGTPDEVTPERWLLRFMAAGIDCVAITDHNSGAWVDQLKLAYAQMKEQNVEGFRELHLFPGVEVSVQGGFHLLAILDTIATTSDIDTLLGSVDYAGTKGDSDGETRKGPAEVIEAVLKVGVAIPAHADGPKGLLEVEPSTIKCRRNTSSVLQVMGAEGILAMEWCNPTAPTPAVFNQQRPRWARILGSDSHSFQGSKVPGSHFTWIKMASPSLEGLRLALLDGNGVSVRRSDEGHFDPWKAPEHFVSRIKISSARFMGNGTPEELRLTPFYNALIGGRGTGKSTIVHALRLAYRRDDEVRRLSAQAEPRRQFEQFRAATKGRDGEGALRDGTEILVELMREGVPHQLRWRTDGQGGPVVEVKAADGRWQASSSQTISADRFPIRLFSQGQIAALAGDNRQALLEVIDEAAAAAPLHRALEENKRTYMAQRARLRELDGKLGARLEFERKLADLSRKLETFTQSHHADVLRAHQRATRQQREVDALLQQWASMPARVETLAQDLVFDDWPAASFEAPGDADMLAWRVSIDASLQSVRQSLAAAANDLTEGAKAALADAKLLQWQSRITTTQSAYEALKETLAGFRAAGARAPADRVANQGPRPNETGP